jgi:NADH-quinone oxidoreductase subunit N
VSAPPLVLELGTGALMLAIFAVGLFAPARDRRVIGLVAAAGVLALAVVALLLRPSGATLGGMFVQDGLALFVKRVFLAATFIGILAGLGSPQFARRSAEYHLLILTSVLGMLTLASARDIILLFLAFELMSIPLYVLTGFAKRAPEALEASLKFFLVGSVSSAVMVYGFSFVYGATGSTSLAVIAKAPADPWLTVGLLAVLTGVAFKIAAFPFHMWVPDTYEAASTPFVA